MRRAPSLGPPALPPAVRLPVGIVAVLSALALVLLGARYAGNSTAGRLDRWAQGALTSLLPEPGRGEYLISMAGDPVPAAVLAAALAAACHLSGRRRLAVLAIAGPLLVGVATTVLKPVIGRTRQTYHGEFFAYPSGHTAVVTALALVTMLLVVDAVGIGTLSAVLFILTGATTAGVAMAVALVARNIHYPTDTVGGFFAALAIVPATAWLVDKPWFDRFPRLAR